jgi:hypothetical protein
MPIAENYIRLRQEVPDHVTIVVAAKTRSAEQITEVIDAGARDIGENYVQEAEDVRRRLAQKAKTVRWHMIGALQTNKINKAIRLFDVFQTVGSMKTAVALNDRLKRAELEASPVLIEINIGSEDSKAGIRPDDHEPFEAYMEKLVADMSHLSHIRVEGLMTMGPRFGDPEKSRPFFRRTRRLFERLADLDLPNVSMHRLSMGMTNSYRVAVEEGSNLIRVGTAIFGPRFPDRQ